VLQKAFFERGSIVQKTVSAGEAILLLGRTLGPLGLFEQQLVEIRQALAKRLAQSFGA